MKTSNVNRLLTALFLAMSVIIVTPDIGIANPCSGGSHGVYTSVLCVYGDVDHEHMVGQGAYLESPNGHLRLYIDAHDMTVMDVTTNPFTGYSTFYGGGSGDPYELEAHACPVALCPSGGGGFVIRDSSVNDLDYAYQGADIAYVKLHDDGCIWLHYPDDGYNTGVCTFG